MAIIRTLPGNPGPVNQGEEIVLAYLVKELPDTIILIPNITINYDRDGAEEHDIERKVRCRLAHNLVHLVIRHVLFPESCKPPAAHSLLLCHGQPPKFDTCARPRRPR